MGSSPRARRNSPSISSHSLNCNTAWGWGPGCTRVIMAVRMPAPRRSRSWPTRALTMVLLPDLTAPITARRQVSSARWACTWARTLSQCSTWDAAWGKRLVHSRASSWSWSISRVSPWRVAVSGTLNFLPGCGMAPYSILAPFLGAKPAM